MLTTQNNHLMLTDNSYEFFRKLVQIILPAVSALYFGLANIWGWPNVEEVVGTIAVVTTFLGVSLGISTQQYKASGAAFDGNVVITEKESGTKQFSLELDGDPDELDKKDSIKFKVLVAPPEE